MWTCPKCREQVDPSFDDCWNCGTSRQGVEDPDFVRAEDMPVIPNEPDLIGSAPDFVSQGPISSLDPGIAFAGDEPIDLVECYWAGDVYEARFVAEQLNERGIPAVADQDSLRQGLGVASFGVPYFQPRVRVREKDLPRARSWIEAYEAAGGVTEQAEPADE